MSAGILEFGEFHLDCERFELLRNGSPVRLERKPMELLILLASSGGRLVSRSEIAGSLWDSEVFVDTEHGINTAIRKIRHTLREDPDNPRFLQTVTGKGYRFVGVTTKDDSPLLQPPAEPAALITPVVLAAPPAARNTHSRRWLIASVAAVLLLVVGIATFGARSVRGHTTHPAITSIAVLPLDNLSGDPSQTYLADGMTDELTTMLAKDSTLRVISRTSVMQYKDAHRPLPEIARQLGVDGILEGSLSRTADKVHMTVQLIYAPTDTHLWAESYDRSLDDTVTLPQNAARSIAAVTHSAVASATAPKYINPAAHDAYLRGHFLWYSGNNPASGKYFLQATQLQPDYALAWAGLASYYGAGAVDFYLDPRQALPLSVAAARKAVGLDPSLPEAHVAFAAAKYWITDWNLDAALNEANRAIELDPKHAQAFHLRSKLLIEQNRDQEGIEMERRSMEIDPFANPWAMAYAFLMARHFDEAITDAKQRAEWHPDPLLWWILSEAYRGKHMDKESEHALEKALVLWNNPAVESIHRAFERGGHNAVLRWQIDDLNTQAKKHYTSPYLLASFYAQLGDKQHALDYLDESLRQHAPPILDIQNDTAFDSLHSDPHYRAIVQKIGLPPAY